MLNIQRKNPYIAKIYKPNYIRRSKQASFLPKKDKNPRCKQRGIEAAAKVSQTKLTDR
jgi:hypothetical protein